MTNNLSIILLTYNNINNTKKCIDLLYKHTPNFSLVIWDNNSSDGTKDYLKQLSDIKDNIIINFNDKNDGIIIGRNKAYEFSQKTNNNAEYIFFLDNDQYVQEGWLESYLSFIDLGYDLVGCEAWLVRSDFYPLKKITNPKDSFNYVGAGGLMAKQNIIEDIELFDKRYAPCYFEDPDLCWRAHNAGYKIGWNYNPVIIHNHRGPLLNNERRQYFLRNWKKFQEKWKDREIPVFKME